MLYSLTHPKEVRSIHIAAAPSRVPSEFFAQIENSSTSHVSSPLLE